MHATGDYVTATAAAVILVLELGHEMEFERENYTQALHPVMFRYVC